MRNDLLSEALVDEALERLRDPRSAQAVERTPEFMASAVTPLNPSTDRAVRNRRVLLGSGFFDRKTARQTRGAVFVAATGAPMIEDPDAVAKAIRELVPAVR